MNWLTPWERMYRYYRGMGVPDEVVTYFSINPPEATQISKIIKQTRPRSILEVGTFIGMSTGIIALSAPESTLVCVDPNAAVAVLSSRFGWHEKRGSLSFVRNMLEHFNASNRVHLLEGYYSCTSSVYDDQYIEQGGSNDLIKKSEVVGAQAAAYAPFDLVFIDGDHTPNGVKSDLSLVYSSLSECGIIVLHDVFGDLWGKQVLAGVEHFICEHPEFSLKTDHNMGFLSRDTAKTGVPPLRNTLIERARKKAVRVMSDL